MENTYVKVLDENQINQVSGGDMSIFINSGATGSILGAMGGAAYNGAAGAGSGLALGGAFALGYSFGSAIGLGRVGRSIGSSIWGATRIFRR